MSRHVIAASSLALVAFTVTSAQAGTKIEPMCAYESGVNGSQKISDYAIVNMESFPIPKGTVVTFTTTGAPGKTFTAKAPSDIAPQDSFSSGGTIPPGGCTAWWMKK